MLKFISLIVAFLYFASCQNVNLFGSYFTSSDLEYKTFLTGYNLDRASNLYVSLGNASQKLMNPANGIIQELLLKAPNSRAKDLNLKLTFDGGRTCKSQSAQLIEPSDLPIILLQHDKPIYKTGDEIKFRVFVLTQKLRPFTSHGLMEVTLTDSKNNLLKTYKNARVDDFGVFEKTLKIAESPNVGTWMIKVKVNQREAIKAFQVQHHNKDDLQVFLKAMPAAYSDQKIFMRIYIKDKEARTFRGTAKITLIKRYKESRETMPEKWIKTIEINGNEELCRLNIERDLDIHNPRADMILTFNVELMNSVTKTFVKVTKEVEMRVKGSHDIQVIRRKYFKPGFNFPIKVRVLRMNGNRDNSFNQLKITVTNENVNKKTGTKTSETKTIQMDLKNGEIIRNLIPTAQTKEMKVVYEFAGTELTETIEPLPTFGANEYMEVKVFKKTKDSYYLGATTTGQEMETLHLLVFGSNGIIHSQEFPEAAGKDVFNFTMKLTDEMRPEARGLVFYVHSASGAIVYDEFGITPGFYIRNSLEISAPQATNPNEAIMVTAKTEEGSKVFLSGIDDMSSLISRTNEISVADIVTELSSYMNYKIPNVTSYHFERLPGFILNPLENGQPCNEATPKNIKANALPSSTPDDFPQKYFPETLFDDSYVSASTRTLKVQNMPGDWRLSGISIHPTKGFTVAKPQQVTAKKDLKVDIHMPSVVNEKEIFEIDVSVFDSLDKLVTHKVDVEIENGFFYEKNLKKVFNVPYPMFNQTTQTIKTIELQVHSSIKLFVSSVGFKDVKIKVFSTINRNAEMMSKSVRVKKQQESDDGNAEIAYGPRTLEGNLLGSIMGGLEQIFTHSLILDEEKVAKFSTAIISFKLLQSAGESLHEKSKKALEDIDTGYQEMLAISEILPTKKDDPHSLWMAATVAEALIEARGIIEVDENRIQSLLMYIKQHQSDDGYFPYNIDADLHRDIGSASIKQKVHTAKILSAFLKDSVNRESQREVIDKSLRKLKESLTSTGPYVHVLVAYVLALNNDFSSVINLVTSGMAVLNRKSHPENQALYLEIASYSILAKVLAGGDAKQEVEWLLKNRSKNGGFLTPYHTALAAQALYAYSMSRNRKNISLTEITGKSLEASGEQTDIEFSFDIKAKFEEAEGNKATLSVIIVPTGNKFSSSNLVVIEVEIPSGYTYRSLDKAHGMEVVNYNPTQNVIRMYVPKMVKAQKYEQTFAVIKAFEVEQHTQKAVKVFDYYKPNLAKIGDINLMKMNKACLRIEEIRDNRVMELNKEIEDLMKRLNELNTDLDKIKTVDCRNNVF